VSEGQLAQILSSLAKTGAAKKAERQSLEEVANAIQNKANEVGLGGKVSTRIQNNGLEVTLLTDRVLFDAGSGDLQPQSFELLTLIGRVLGGIDNPIEITGYTDSDPIHTARFPSNEELSFARALSVKQFLIQAGVPRTRLEATGNGADHNVAPNDTPENKAKNRRVEIFVQSNLVKQVQDEAGLNDELDESAPTPTSEPIANPAHPGVEGVDPGLKNPVTGGGG
jgi:chemotaxis protein MotB